MRYFAFCTCLLLLVREGALSQTMTPNTTDRVDGNTTDTYSSLSTAGMNVSATQPSHISSPSAGSSNATIGHGTGTGAATPQTNTTTCPTNNASPGDANRATSTPTHPPNMTTITRSHANMTSAPSNHTYSTVKSGHEQPIKGGTATLLGFPNRILGAVLAVVLFNL